MRSQQSLWARGARNLLACMLALSACMSVAACGEAPSASPAPAAPSAGASREPAAEALVPLSTRDVTSFSRSAERLTLPRREYRYPGSVDVDDYSEHTAALTENAGEHQRLFLMDLATGRRGLIFARATFDSPGYWIGTVQVSDSWLVWEEVGPGDDLAEQVDWRLYAAPLRPNARAVGTRSLVASASNVRATRPLFDLDGSRLVWSSTAWTGAGTMARSRVVLRDLDAETQRVLRTTRGVVETVSFKDGLIVVSEKPRQDEPGVSIVVLDQESGEARAGFGAGNEYALSHWPAWREGWLAWSPFPAAEATYPLLYLRDTDGHTYADGGFAVDPCFAGGYLFYQTCRSGAPGEGETREVRALRLSDMTSLILESGSPEDNEWWSGTVGAPDLETVYLTHLDKAPRATERSEKYTIVRVYDLRQEGG